MGPVVMKWSITEVSFMPSPNFLEKLIHSLGWGALPIPTQGYNFLFSSALQAESTLNYSLKNVTEVNNCISGDLRLRM